jgi:hypothetical protein
MGNSVKPSRVVIQEMHKSLFMCYPVDLLRADSAEQEYRLAYGMLFWFAARGQVVPAITKDIAEVDADRGSDQRPYLVGQDRLETGS